VAHNSCVFQELRHASDLHLMVLGSRQPLMVPIPGLGLVDSGSGLAYCAGGPTALGNTMEVSRLEPSVAAIYGR